MYLRNKQRRTSHILVIILALVMLTAACGGNPASEASPSPSAKPAETTSPGNQQGTQTEDEGGAGEAATRKVVDDLNREVDIPVHPKRIVAGEFAAELLALGIKPIASGDNGFKVIYTLDDMEGVERIGDPPNPEVLLELNPDLMVAPTVFKEIYPEQMEQISKITPVFYLSFDQDPIYGIFARLAELVGETGKAEAWIAEYEQEAELARQQLKSAIGDETVSIFRIEKGRLRIYLNRNFGGYMLRSSLQAAAPAAVAAEIEKNPNSSALQISLEKLPEFAGDHMFIIVRGEGDDREAFKEIEDSGFWKSLDAVKNGKLHFLETDKYYGSDVTTIRETMKEAVDMLAAAPAKGTKAGE